MNTPSTEPKLTALSRWERFQAWLVRLPESDYMKELDRIESEGGIDADMPVDYVLTMSRFIVVAGSWRRVHGAGWLVSTCEYLRLFDERDRMLIALPNRDFVSSSIDCQPNDERGFRLRFPHRSIARGSCAGLNCTLLLRADDTEALRAILMD